MPQDREEEMRRLNPMRDDVAHGAGGIGGGEARSFGADRLRPDGLREDVAVPCETAVPCEVATGDRHDSYLEPDADQGLRARFTAPACGPAQAVHGETATSAQPIENAAVLPDAPSVWDARPRP
jgi:hypothetical protein